MRKRHNTLVIGVLRHGLRYSIARATKDGNNSGREFTRVGSGNQNAARTIAISSGSTQMIALATNFIYVSCQWSVNACRLAENLE